MKKSLFTLLLGAAIIFIMSSCNSKKNNEVNNAENDSTAVASFDYTPTEPVNGTKKAVIELGASGFNLFVVEIDKDKNWKALRKDFGSSVISEGMTSAQVIKTKLEDYIKSVIDSSGVDGKNIHFVVSSGAAKEKITEEITGALKQIGYYVNTVTPEQEAEYAFLCTLPKGYEDKAFVTDIGSNNTKVAWMADGKKKTEESYGAKYFQKGTDDKTVYEDVKVKLTGIPEQNCKTLFLIGGVPFKMAKMQKKGDERYTVLSTKISDYDELIKKEGDKMKSGINIYKAIVDATCAEQVVFDWDANFAIGFLLNMK